MEFEKNRRLLSYARRAIDEYEMIKEGDRIAVGISGGSEEQDTALADYAKQVFENMI